MVGSDPIHSQGRPAYSKRRKATRHGWTLQVFVEVRQVVLGRVGAQAEGCADLAVGEAVGNHRLNPVDRHGSLATDALDHCRHGLRRSSEQRAVTEAGPIAE